MELILKNSQKIKKTNPNLVIDSKRIEEEIKPISVLNWYLLGSVDIYHRMYIINKVRTTKIELYTDKESMSNLKINNMLLYEV